MSSDYQILGSEYGTVVYSTGSGAGFRLTMISKVEAEYNTKKPRERAS